jgi:hypothetical protein
MKLADFLSERSISVPEFGRRIGLSAESVRRYCDGHRIPKRSVMSKIFEETGGAVAANDFFGLTSEGKSSQSAQAAE